MCSRDYSIALFWVLDQGVDLEGPDLQLWGPDAIKMWRPLTETKNLCYEDSFSFLLIITTKNTNYFS
jgi:hypothetical protein